MSYYVGVFIGLATLTLRLLNVLDNEAAAYMMTIGIFNIVTDRRKEAR